MLLLSMIFIIYTSCHYNALLTSTREQTATATGRLSSANPVSILPARAQNYAIVYITWFLK